MALGAGRLYTNAIMGQWPSTAEREHARKASSTILREDSIRIEESENVSMDSWSMHYERTTQAPYSPIGQDGLIPRSDLSHPTKENTLHDMTHFLRNTGPLPPHRRPSKIENPSKALARRRKAMQFLKIRQHSSYEDEQICAELRDEGGLLHPAPEQPLPKGYERKVSSTGQRYIALQMPEQPVKCVEPSLQSPSVEESRVSIYFTDSVNPPQPFGQRKCNRPAEHVRSKVHPAWRGSYDFACAGAEMEIGAIGHSSTPIRPSASDPPTPEPMSAISFTESFRSDVTAKRSMDSPWPIKVDHVFATTSSSLPLPHTFDMATDADVHQQLNERDVEIKHPSPRRFASHTALLQRSSTVASCRRSITESPGPPPRSPLRLQRESRNIEDIITSYNYERAKPKIAPPIRDINELKTSIKPIRPTVVTECTGPWPKSARKDREERIRARKIRDRPSANIDTPTPVGTIDAIVRAPLAAPRQRLRKARPHIQIPDLRTVSLSMRAPSDASSNASWKKITESIRTPVSAVPSQSTPTTCGEKTGYTPISPTASNASVAAEAFMAISPVMLVAEEIPIAKVKPSPKPARLVVREGKSYAPRPRSASIPRSAMKRRSHHGGQTPSRPGSPSHQYEKDKAPSLPSPPPNRALPPTPPASGSEKPNRAKFSTTADAEKDLPSLPSDKIISELKETTPHIASQVQRKPVPPPDISNNSGINARLEALEKQNAMLAAALTTVLRSNGTVNGSIYNFADPLMQRPPMAWQQRMERRSAASHGPSNGNDGAMRLYHNTRREI